MRERGENEGYNNHNNTMALYVYILWPKLLPKTEFKRPALFALIPQTSVDTPTCKLFK